MKTSQLVTIYLLLHVVLQIEGQIQVSKCGQLYATSLAIRVTNGFSSNHHWPWHAAIYHQIGQSDPSYKCGGTLISTTSVLTAAHCVSVNNAQVDVEIVTILLGRLNLAKTEDSGQSFGVSEILVHPDYNSIDYVNDISIIRLSTDAIFNDYVQPICLWKSDKTDLSEVVGKMGTVIGWGRTENGSLSTTLQQANYPVVDLLTCIKSNPLFFGSILTEKSFCAGNRNGTGLCQGDSGGSITFEEKGIYYIRGLVSVGQEKRNPITQNFDCDSMQYTVFTDVAKFLPWIIGNTSMEREENINSRAPAAPLSGQPNAVNMEIDFSICGQLSLIPMSLMVNSYDARHWPWHAAIYHHIDSNPTYQCGGTVISSKAILTAAHCVQNEQISVSLGRLNLGVDENSAQTFRVAEVIVHPQYDDKNSHNDIAIVKLPTDAIFDRYVRPVCLWNSSNTDLSEIVGKLGTVVGWGETEATNQSNVLQEATFPVVSHYTCRQSDGKVFGDLLYDNNFCAGHRNGTNTCNGDGGGSITFEVNGIYYIRGIVAFGGLCGSSFYDVFTDVTKYLTWIKDNQ